MSAVISECGKYRYHLERDLPHAYGVTTFIMLNPSTADAEQDDPTIRRCKGFATAWGNGRLVVVNLFAFRATKPADMRAASDPIGPDNFKTIHDAAAYSKLTSGHVVCAWGTHGSYRDQDRRVMEFLKRFDIPTKCLGTTAGGYPRHPLYVPAAQQLVPYEGRP